MIKWKQRLYALFLRQVLGPFLDTKSRQILHESIEFSFNEGIFTLHNIGLCTSYLNEKLQQQLNNSKQETDNDGDGENINKKKKSGLLIKKARIASITIQLSLIESTSSTTSSSGSAFAAASDHNVDPSSSAATAVASSLAWRAMNLGYSVALVAHVEIDGIELEVEAAPGPSPSSQEKQQQQKGNSRRSSDYNITDTSTTNEEGLEDDRQESGFDAFAQTKSMLSSYLEAALGSLRLTLKVTNLSLRLCSNQTSPSSSPAGRKRSFVEVRLPSLTYHDMDHVSGGNNLDDTYNYDESHHQRTTNDINDNRRSSRTIFGKTILFQGITVSVGELSSNFDDSRIKQHHTTNPVVSSASTIAMAEGAGQISVRAVEFLNNNKQHQHQHQHRVQQDIDVRINQQVKVSVSETSLMQIQAVAKGFGGGGGGGDSYRPESTEDELDDDKEDTLAALETSKATQKEQQQQQGSSCLFSSSGPTCHTNDDGSSSTASSASAAEGGGPNDPIDYYTIDGIMKQYQKARQLAERNELLRGGILVPSNAFEEGDNVGEGDPRTFDVFFDANDMSFHNYASMMKSSVVMASSSSSSSSQEGGGSSTSASAFSSNFVHTKFRLHLAGGGVKVSFRGQNTGTKTFLGPEEYVLLTFDDLEVTSRLSRRRVELSLQVAHLEVDDAQIPQATIGRNNNDNNEGRPRVEIGNLLCFGEPPDDVGGAGDILLQPACISVQVTVDTDKDGGKGLDLELSLKPIELLYRERTFSHLKALATKLDTKNSNTSRNESSSIARDAKSKEDETESIFNSVLCTVSSLTVTLPVLSDEMDMTPLFARCGHYLNKCTSTHSALGFVIDTLSFEHTKCKDSAPKEGQQGMVSSTATLDIHSFLAFASSPEYSSNGHVRRRSHVIDVLGVSGRFEVNASIPITVAYKCNMPGLPNRTNVAKDTFPSVPAFSTFKARQEDEEEDEEIDRVLSERLSNVTVDSRRALRAKDPQGEMLQKTENCEAVIMVHIPDINLDLAKEEMEVLLAMVKCILPKTEAETKDSEANDTKASSSGSAVAVSVAIDSVSLCIMDKENHHGRTTWNSHLIRLDKCRAYTIVGGESSRFCRLLAHEATFFEMVAVQTEKSVNFNSTPQTVEARALNLKSRTTQKWSASVAPVFYRSKLFPAISHLSPSILLDIIQSPDQREQSIYLSLYHITYRYDPDSKWLETLQRFFLDLIPQNDKDGVTDTETEYEVASKSSLTRVFLSLADCNFDYTSLRHFTTPSRSILRLGDLRFSSNIVKPAVVQAYSLSMGDFSWCLCNTRASHNFENSLLPIGAHLMAPEDLVYRPNQSQVGYSTTTTETVFRDMCFKTILTLESMDLIVVKTVASEPSVLPPKEPGLTVSLTLGELSLYLCKDSFQCFKETVGELQTKMTAVSEEKIEDMKSQMAARQYDLFNQKRGKLTLVRPNKPKHDVAAIPVDDEDDFLLDGYDWTTIDHTSRSSEIPPGEEQTARWFNSSPIEDGRDSGLFQSFPGPLQDASASTHPSSQPRIITQHFPLHAVSDPLSDGDMDASKYAGTDSVLVDTRVLLHDLKVKVRLFDGYDWPEYQSKKAKDPMALFVIAERSINEQHPRESDKNHDKKSALLNGLLAGGDENTATFGDLPLPEERVRRTMAQNDLRRLSRRTNSYIQFSACGVSARVDSYRYSTEHRLKTCVGLSLKDFFLAETISSLNPVKMFGEWFNEREHPRDSKDGLLMLKMATWEPLFPLTPEMKLASEECEVAVTLAPMRCILDQRAIQFAQAFFDHDEEGAKGADWAADLNLIPAPFVRSLHVMPWKIKVDYTPQRIDTEALKNGSIIELLNLSPLDSMVLTLPKVEIEDSSDFGEAISTLIGRWLGDVKSTQLHKFLANARPFEPITTIGGGVADLFVLPWDAYKNGDNVSRALRSSVSSLVGNVAHETLTTSSRLTGYIAAGMTEAAVGNQLPTGASNSSLPSRPLATPHRVGDTANHAIESLARGVQTANYKVVIVPFREFRRTGTTGAVKSIARGIPVAIAAPVGGASEALSYTLLGARNQIRPDIRKEEEISQRGLHYGGI